MRIVILSIALLFCAFSAHSQVLKSAGVWYFLDVDSMTARPAVLPNGTELAYVVGTKKIYYWNRTTSTWTEYSAGGGGLTMPFDSIYFNPTTADPDTAELKYNADLETFVFGADGTIIEIGQKSAWYVKNQTGSTINKGTVVRASGTLGSSGRILISPMVIDGTVDSKYLLGITASDIADGADGYVIHFGKLRKFNTSSWSDGAVLYAGTGGTLTATEPSPPNLRLPIAFVVHSHATNGILAIRIQTGNELHELHDVDTTGIDNGGVIVWNAVSEKWEASDGAAITTADTISLLATKYWTGANFFPILGGTLTGTGGAGFIGFPSQVSAPGTPASGLNVYAQGSSFNWKGTDGYERQFASTLTGGRTYTLPDVSGTFALGTGTADRSARWSATNTVTTGNFTDNGTKLQALLPFQFQTYTTAGLPAGVTGYHVYNTTTNGPGWYQGSRWAYAIESTINRGTNTYIPYFDANGQLTQNIGLTWNQAAGRLKVSNDANNLFRISGGAGDFITHGTSPGARDIAFGLNATAGVYYSMVFGRDVVATANDQVVFGNPAGNANKVRTFYLNGNATVAANGIEVSVLVGAANGTDRPGGNLVLNSGPGTGSSTAGDMIFATPNVGVSGTTVHSLTNKWWIKATNGRLGNIASPNYLIDVTSTDAFGLPRGTVAQRPTIASSTTPIRFNTDSTALEYGESVGTWRLLATRAYARSLATSLPTTITSGHVAYSNGTSLVGSANHFWDNSNSRLGLGTTSPSEQLHITDDLRVGDSTRLTTTPAHSAITGLLTRDANGWVGAASLAGGLSYSGGVLTGANWYTADGTVSTYRTANLGSNGDYFYTVGVSNQKQQRLLLSDANGNNTTDLNSQALFTSGLDYDLRAGDYEMNSFQGTRLTVKGFKRVTRDATSKVSSIIEESFYNNSYNNSQYIGQIVQQDSISSSQTKGVSGLTMRTQAGTSSPRYHFSGFGYGGITQKKLGEASSGFQRFINYSPKWALQTQFHNTDTYFDWLRIDNLDTDTTSNRISFYNGKYTFPNASPGSGAKVLQWSSGTPSFVDASSLAVNTVYTASDSIRGNRYLEMANDGSATTAVGYWPSFPSRAYSISEYGLFVKPNSEVTITNQKDHLVMYNGSLEIASGRTGIYDGAFFNVSPHFITTNVSRISGANISALRQDTLGLVYYPSFSSSDTLLRILNSRHIKLFNKYELVDATPGTGSNVHVWDNGTPSFKEIKRDTTIFVTADTDYDFSAAVTTAQIASRYNRIIIHMTLTSGVGADKTTTLHAPDANLMQCEILIRGTDNTGTYDNEINFGTNNAISSDGTNTSGYTLAQGQGLHVRVVYNGSAYKYIYY